MISSKLADKIYGAVHDEHNFRYVGFCKKVRSDEIQNVDVFIDGKKVDTLTCNKTIDKISNIYDKDGFEFTYSVPNEYIGKKYKITFTCNKLELENSPQVTISQDDERYNEYMFMKSLYEPFLEDKVKNLYCKDAIGFLAKEENLKDIGFMEYIKELMVRFPEVTIKAFYFNNNQKKLAESVFKEEIYSLELIMPKSIYDLAREITIYICSIRQKTDQFLHKIIRSKCKNIYSMYNLFAIPNIKQMSLNDFDNLLSKNKHILLDKAEKCKFSKDEINISKGSYHKLFYGKLFDKLNLKIDIDLNSNAFEFRNFELVKYIFKYQEFKSLIFELNSNIRKVQYQNET